MFFLSIKQSLQPLSRKVKLRHEPILLKFSKWKPSTNPKNGLETEMLHSNLSKNTGNNEMFGFSTISQNSYYTIIFGKSENAAPGVKKHSEWFKQLRT